MRNREADEILAVEVASFNAGHATDWRSALWQLDAWLESGLSYIDSTEDYYDAE